MDPLTPCGCCQLRAADKELQTPYTRLGATEVYAHMLRECFGIHVTLSGEGSCGICSVCVGRLRDASDFKLQVQRTQTELQARLKEETPGNGEESALESVTEWGDAGSDCSDEPVWTLDGAAGADAEPAPSVSLRARQQLAMACSVRLARLRDSPRASQPATVQREPRTQPYTCDTCQAHFTHKSRLITHLQNLCKQRNKRETLLVKHNEKKPHVCNVCNKGFAQIGDLTRHKHTHSGVKPHICKVCNRAFSRTGHLKCHEITHTGVKPYICKVCNKGFTQKGSLNIHENIHSGVKPYVCKVCNKRFTQKGSLNSHENTHSGVKPYVCKVCGKRFAQTGDLKRHENIHSGVSHMYVRFVTNCLHINRI
ncbi:zinc finger protein 436-like isoform X2 [Leguminivora glycinivorella]|uniref:zinc finger protein 436-like isoform X2 n=1 Tax=Leguminivora glycinivorella TaxID=1035111 RepID=UPI00200F605C|nr:zinc finger protein 436-like isoform X2 [Leguminivora glycinivorella]